MYAHQVEQKKQGRWRGGSMAQVLPLEQEKQG